MKNKVVLLSLLLLISCLILSGKIIYNNKNEKDVSNIKNQIQEIDNSINNFKSEIERKKQLINSDSIDESKEKELEVWKKELEKINDLS